MIKFTDMSKRRNLTASFIFKVVLEALKEQQTLAELAKKHSVHANQISAWKKEFIDNGPDVFSKKSSTTKDEDVDKLYKVIGKQKVEIDFLQKALS